MDSLLSRQSGKSIVVVRDLRKTYGSVVALDDLTLEMPRAAVGLLGANGAGKTTLIRVLLGLQDCSRGHAEVLGMPVGRSATGTRELVGYLPESDCLPAAVTAADFVAHMGQMSGLPVRAARLRAAETLYHCGVDEERYRRIGEFSTGMKQRVKLAQAIVHDPEIVFLDEPTNGMDPEGREDMLKLIRRIHSELGITVVLSSHILDDVEKVCDYVVMLDRGRLAAAGAMRDLVEGGGQIVVEIEGDVTEFAERVSQAGLAVAQRGPSELGIERSSDDSFDIIRNVAAELEVSLRSLHLDTRSLEDVYIQRLVSTDKRGEPLV